MTKTLDFIKVSPPKGQEPEGLIVALHGWGANAQDVASLLPFFNLPNYQFLFPNAPFVYPYSPTGKAWYDLRAENMYEGLTESRQMVTDWLISIESNTGIPLSRTILSGFSQGGAMTLDVGLSLPLAGLVVMSGYLHPGVGATTNSNFPPTLIMHGRQDEVVPVQAAWKTRETVESLGVALEYHEFDMGHEISPQMLGVLRNFVVNAIA
ncbi:alpha/beta hydrolase [Cylindrospermum sp. FACHB-282]|uniref:alpha/beta hydrolase n=1 Tax=Cylindrospermum sp. FACHB-282 TaxID=2692794 RepID=UPI0016862A6B|nr:alpha/beta hydrolase [Cylindrospermum sp. FACHB-282]MBD2386504.1 alpha/beta hydrolase [Cylindrospermum sp. FACHB-282]